MNSARYAILEGAIKEIGDFKVTLFGDICPDHVISTGGEHITHLHISDIVTFETDITDT